jgi:hypothetical protein
MIAVRTTKPKNINGRTTTPKEKYFPEECKTQNGLSTGSECNLEND